MLGNLAKTHIFTLLHPINPISHLGRSQFFFLVVYLVYLKVFLTILFQRICRKRKNIPLKVAELPQVTYINSQEILIESPKNTSLHWPRTANANANAHIHIDTYIYIYALAGGFARNKYRTSRKEPRT